MDPIKRFSRVVESYVKYRPTYPQAVIGLLSQQCGLTSDSIVADVGSGTGILSRLFLDNGNRVYGIEPNDAMQAAGEKALAEFSGFVSVKGSAEATTLPGDSIDFVVAGQAFHWFNGEKAKTEFRRILKRDGWTALIWNERRLDSTPFLRAYENLLLRYGTDYPVVRHENIYGEVAQLFAPNQYELKVFDNHQTFDFEGAKGRLLSASYVPASEDQSFPAMLEELRSIFEQHQESGTVTFEYDTRVYFGRLPN